MHWFDVDKEGLAKILAGRGPEFIGRELVQNALDENTTRRRFNSSAVMNILKVL